MDLEKVESVIQLMRTYGLHELEIKEQDNSIRVVQAPNRDFMPSPFAAPYAAAPYAPVFNPAPVQDERARDGARNEAGGERAVYAEKKHSNAFEVRSPFVGTYYASSDPGAEAFVAVGQKVKKGDTLCIIEAMKLMNEIEADRDGVVVEILAENEQPVEFNQLLFLIE